MRRDRAVAPLDVARGLLLLGVFHVHALYALMPQMRDAGAVALGQVQIQFLTAHVVLFFALSGMSSRSLADKPAALVLQRSLSLWLLAVTTHIACVLIDHALWRSWDGAYPLLRDLGKPILLGTGWASFAWFFVVLAVVRLFAFAWTRARRVFFATALTVGLLVAVSLARQWPDNLYEWRYWPAAFALFMIGMRLRADGRIPCWAGVPAALAGLLLPALNHPSLLSVGPCLACHPDFLVEPMIGHWGLLPLFVLQIGLSLIGLLWLAQVLASGAAGRFLATLGRRSLQLLVLHGWITFSIYGMAAYLPLQTSGAWVFAAVLVVNPLLHIALYRLLHTPLDRVVALCGKASQRLVALGAAARRGRAHRRAGLSWRAHDL